MEKKRGRLFVGLFFIVIIFLTQTIFALGIRPAITNLNFESNLEREIQYTIFGGSVGRELEIVVQGDFAEYIKTDKTKLSDGGGKFIATLKLPEDIEIPGRHKILVGVKEKLDEELVTGFIGISSAINAIIVIDVPYPGKYLTLNLNSHDVNIGEPVIFKLKIMNMGKEDVNITPEIEIISEGKLLDTLYFKNRILKSQTEIELVKMFNTTNYNPGNYNATAIVDYGKIAKAESSFKIGDLIINLINYTNKVILGEGIKSFDIVIESGWNDKIDGAYAEVFFYNNSETLLSFETSTTNLNPWEEKIITGFFDTTNLTEGFYDANITFFYYGKEVGKSSSEIVKVEFVKKMKNLLIPWMIVGGVILTILIILGVQFVKRKYKNAKKKK